MNGVLPYESLRAANVLATKDCLRLGLPIVYISSLSSLLSMESGDVFDDPLTPCSLAHLSGYGATKRASEVLVSRAHILYGLPVLIVRPGSIGGASSVTSFLESPQGFGEEDNGDTERVNGMSVEVSQRDCDGALSLKDTISRYILALMQLGVAPDLPRQRISLVNVDHVARIAVHGALHVLPSLGWSVPVRPSLSHHKYSSDSGSTTSSSLPSSRNITKQPSVDCLTSKTHPLALNIFGPTASCSLTVNEITDAVTKVRLVRKVPFSSFLNTVKSVDNALSPLLSYFRPGAARIPLSLDENYCAAPPRKSLCSGDGDGDGDGDSDSFSDGVNDVDDNLDDGSGEKRAMLGSLKSLHVLEEHWRGFWWERDLPSHLTADSVVKMAQFLLRAENDRGNIRNFRGSSESEDIVQAVRKKKKED